MSYDTLLAMPSAQTEREIPKLSEQEKKFVIRAMEMMNSIERADNLVQEYMGKGNYSKKKEFLRYLFPALKNVTSRGDDEDGGEQSYKMMLFAIISNSL